MGMALASTALASPALAKEGAWYVGVDAGLMKVDGSTINRDGPELDHDEGSDFGLVVGHDFGGFRLETELSQKEASLEAVGNFVAAGKTSHTSFMLNGMFDFGPDDGLQGFFGAGIGIARSSAESNTTGTAATWWDDSATGLAWQVLAGGRAPLSDRWDVGLKYRYFNADKIGITSRLGTDVDFDIASHSLLGSLVYNFGGLLLHLLHHLHRHLHRRRHHHLHRRRLHRRRRLRHLQCATLAIRVFFNWDEADVTPEAAAVLDNAVSAYADCGTAKSC